MGAPEKLEHIKAYLKEQGIVLLEVPRTAGCIAPQLDLKKLFRQLGDRGIDSVLLEGGGTLNASALRQGLVQRVYAFVAPKLIAGADAKSPVEGTGRSDLPSPVNMTGNHMPAKPAVCSHGPLQVHDSLHGSL